MSKKIIVFCALFLICLNFFAWREVFGLICDSNLKVYFLDVGQGDANFIQTPQNHYILIDGGPDSLILEKLNKTLPFWNRGLDLVILTHPEKDHLTGILEILKRYRVNNFLWTGVIKNDIQNKELATLLEKIQQRKESLFFASLIGPSQTKVLTIKAGDKIRAGDVLIDTLYPIEDMEGKEAKKTTNDSCLVLKLIFGKNSFLFTGDIGFAEEKNIINLKKDISAEVLKIAHHGSKYSTSESFLENVKPEIAVIEVGKNKYGHPAPETLQRLKNFGIKKIFITNRDGDIKISSDGNQIYW